MNKKATKYNAQDCCSATFIKVLQSIETRTETDKNEEGVCNFSVCFPLLSLVSSFTTWFWFFGTLAILSFFICFRFTAN